MATILRGPYTIAPDSTWTDAAATWPVAVVPRQTEPDQLGPDGLIVAQDEGRLELRDPVTQLHLTCGTCGQSVLCLQPYDAAPYLVTTADMTAGILSHLRRSHEDVVESR